MDGKGNPKAASYAEANMEHLFGYGNTGLVTQSNVSQLGYTVTGSNGSTPANLQTYSFETMTTRIGSS